MGKQTTLFPNNCQLMMELVNGNEFLKNSTETYAGNKAAGVRLRKQLAQIEKFIKEAKKETIKIKNFKQ